MSDEQLHQTLCSVPPHSLQKLADFFRTTSELRGHPNAARLIVFAEKILTGSRYDHKVSEPVSREAATTLKQVEKPNIKHAGFSVGYKAKATLLLIFSPVIAALAAVGTILISPLLAAGTFSKPRLWKQQKHEAWMQGVKRSGMDEASEQLKGPLSAKVKEPLEKMLKSSYQPKSAVVAQCLRALAVLDAKPPKVSVKDLKGASTVYGDFETAQKQFRNEFREAYTALHAYVKRYPNDDEAQACKRLLGCYALAMFRGTIEFNKSYSRNLRGLISGDDVKTPWRTHQALGQLKKKEQPLSVDLDKLRGEFNLGFDPSRYNLSHTLATLSVRQPTGGSKDVQVIRMGTPTQSGWGSFLGLRNNSQITPEYQAYLGHLQSKGQTHLDVIVQMRTDGEGHNTKTRIEAAHKFGHVAICLPQDGRLYHMSGGTFGAEYIQLDDFIAKASHHMTHSPEYYLGTPALLSQDELTMIFRQTAAKITGLSAPVTKEHRKVLLDLVYARIVATVAQKAKVDSLNMTCKDGIDRGAVATATVLRAALGPRLQVGSQAEEALLLGYESGAFQTKQQVVISSRHGRFVAAHELIAAEQIDLFDGIIHGVVMQFSDAPIYVEPSRSKSL
jgi:hypothetical protein